MVRNPLNVLVLAGLLGSSVSAIEVPKGFVVETVVAGLEAPTAFASTPDGRFFIAEQTGVLRVWKQGRLLTEPALVLPGAAGEAPQPIALVLAPAFPHPPHLFVLHDGGPASGDPVLARYTVVGDRADPETRKVLLGEKDSSSEAQPMRRGFPGGALCFGPDGTLWVAVADRTAGDAGVRVGSFGGKIYCVQPDGTPPAKNPFRNRLDRRFHPVFATGVLDPSGMALQPPWEGGRVFFADRRGGRTLIHELVAGSNYGNPDGPVSDFDDESRAPRYSDETGGIPDVAGGAFCSRRSSWPAEWRGRFFFASPSGHAIHALDPDQAATPVLYAQGLKHPVAMEFGADGSLLVLNRGAGGDNANAAERGTGSLIRIRYVAPGATPTAAMPLGATVPGHRVALGLPADPRELPRSIKVGELYQRMAGGDGRHFGLVHSPWTRGVHDFLSMALPPGQRLRVTRDSEVLFPPGTVFVRTFNRYPVGTRLADGRGAISFETRLIVVGDPWGYGASYRWRAPHPTFLDNAEDADLVEEGELADVGFSRIVDHKAKRQVVHSISWWFPGVDDRWTFQSRNPSYHIPTSTWELASLMQAFRLQFDPPLPTNAWSVYRTYRGLGEQDASPEEKVRAYLHGNCSICHQPDGAASGTFDARLTTPLTATGLIQGVPVAGDLGIAGARLLVPGEPEKSLLYQRLVRPGLPSVPPGIHYQEDNPVAPVLEAWIRGLAPP